MKLVKIRNLKILVAFTINLTLIFFKANICFAQISIIRESQTEKTIRDIAIKLFKNAGLEAESIKIFIVNDNSINAFVSGGQNIFINLGLIQKFENPEIIAGVLAHEIGHIAGGHLAKSSEIYNKNLTTTLIGYLLGVGAIASGNADAGTALILGSSHIGNRMSLKYSRNQEEEADILALKYLQESQYPNTGLLDILTHFQQESVGLNYQINEFELTHPISSSRIKLIKNFNEQNQFRKYKLPANIYYNFGFSRAKLKGFLEDINEELMKNYNNLDDNSSLVLAINYHRQGDFKNSQKILDKIITKHPKDGFLYELKADFLLSENKVFEAIYNYKKALKFLEAKSKVLAQINMASAIIKLQTNDKFLLDFALKNLKNAMIYEEDNPLIYQELAKIYFLQKLNALENLALAQYNFLINNRENTEKYAKIAIAEFDKCNEKNNTNKNCQYLYLKIKAQDLLVFKE
ncbi:MAG: M48 family metalloprotease [Rickettsiales bacterium]